MINSNFHCVAKKIKTSRKTRTMSAQREHWEKESERERERAKVGRMRSRYFPTVVGGTFHCGRQNFNTPNSRPAAAEQCAELASSEQFSAQSERTIVFSEAQVHKAHTTTRCVLFVRYGGTALRCCHTQRRIFTFSTHTHSTQTKSGKNKKKKRKCTRKEENFENSLWKLLPCVRFELCVCVKIFHNLIKKYNNANIRNNRNRESRKAQNVTNSTKERAKKIYRKLKIKCKLWTPIERAQVN